MKVVSELWCQPKERHEGTGKGRQTFEKDGEGRFGTDGIAKEHREKIDHLVVPSPSTGEVTSANQAGSEGTS